MTGAKEPDGRPRTAALVALLTAIVVSAVLVAPADSAGVNGTTQPGLTVNVTGEGIVTYSDGSPPCSTVDCVTQESRNKLVFLTAIAAQGYTFTGWTKGCVSTGAICGVTPAQAPVVSAEFARTGDFELTVSGPGIVIGDGAGINCGLSQSSCSAQLSGVGTTEFTPGPSPGAVFLGWGGECAQFATGSCTVDNGAYGGATATFAPVTPPASAQSLSVTHEGPVTSAPDQLDACLAAVTPCVTSVPGGTAYTLTAGGSFVTSPSSRPPPVEWSGACVGSWPECALVVDGPTAVNVLGELTSPSSATAHPAPVTIQVTVTGRGRLQALQGTLSWPGSPKRTGCGSSAVGGGYQCTLTEAGGAFQLRAVPVGRNRFRRWAHSGFITVCTPAKRANCAGRVPLTGTDLAAAFTGG